MNFALEHRSAPPVREQPKLPRTMLAATARYLDEPSTPGVLA
ncbi:MAG TPA: hypothetical protein VLX59_15435 [Acidimicrobiales bacterium]|nr:hypothetical protein [Acidimicrobiales bacterium]